ncbi:dihydroneopterin aldolase [Psychrobacter sp. I-STPA6b]|uniref:dihydroneopterin aldolase n=1 Tax=Psychrobacter sp. I-STPA6b TaxID=2585718 RepID=UPI001D0C9E0A|nr:dihydroneopterin aldolase [Psychrobacter sp. I-STPA6b]
MSKHVSQPVADTVFIEGLKVETVIGVLEWERHITQPLFIDLTMAVDMNRAAYSDDVADTVSYKSVCDDVTLWCQQEQAGLLERLAVMIAEKLLTQYPISQVTVKIAKPTAITEAKSVGVQITRRREQAVGNHNGTENSVDNSDEHMAGNSSIES